MRDYVQFFATQDSQPWIPTVVTQFYFFSTQDQAQKFVDSNPVSPGGGTLGAVFPIWFRLNKDIALGYINNANITNIGTATSPVLDGQGKQMIWLSESPRRFGVNSVEEKKEASPASAKTGSTAGAGTLLTVLDLLLQLVDTLKAEGRLRDAGIVQYAYDRVIDGTFSITQALDYLRANNLP